MTIQDREVGWLNVPWFECVCEETLRLTVRYRVAVPAFVAMPDHLHFLVAGTSAASDQMLFVRALRRILNATFPDEVLLQKQAYDHVLRPSEHGPAAFAATVFYLTQNPVRAELVANSEDWLFIASLVPEEQTLSPSDADFSSRWWAWWNRRVDRES
jgi:REP element-mobilizing transposase RayT